jgi:hypothetical protein
LTKVLSNLEERRYLERSGNRLAGIYRACEDDSVDGRRCGDAFAEEVRVLIYTRPRARKLYNPLRDGSRPSATDCGASSERISSL